MGALSDDIHARQLEMGVINADDVKSRRYEAGHEAGDDEAISGDFGIDYAWKEFSKAYPEMSGNRKVVEKAATEVWEEGGYSTQTKRGCTQFVHAVGRRLQDGY